MEPETLPDIVRRLYNTGNRSASAIADSLVDEIQRMHKKKSRELLIRLVLPIVRSELRTLAGRQISMARVQERRDRAGGRTTIHHRAGPNPDPNDALTFLDCDVPLSSGVVKKYGDLTLDDHSQRVVIHHSDRAAADWSIRGHRWASDKITAHRVNCLNDIPRQELAAEVPMEGIRP
jgi:hypothetical protein